MTGPIARLRQDLKKLRQHRKEHEKDRKDYRKDQRELERHQKALKKDLSSLKFDKKQGDKEHKLHDRAQAVRDRHAEKKDAALAEIAAQRAAIDAQYQATVDPATGQGDPALAAQLSAIDTKAAVVGARFDQQLTADQAAVDGARAKIQDRREQIRDDRAEIKADRKEIKDDRKDVKAGKKELDRDRDRIKSAKKRALDHLRPAEYEMGLKATNRARKELGLKPVDEVIRPGVKNTVGGQIGKWIAEAQTILKKHGVPMSKMSAKDIAIIIKHESGGNPNAQNNWDINAANGTPSIGLMQTIGPTFNAYKLPGHGNIRNPVDNIIAATRYAIARYGSVSRTPGPASVNAGGPYKPY